MADTDKLNIDSIIARLLEGGSLGVLHGPSAHRNDFTRMWERLLAGSGWERMFSIANIFTPGVATSLLGGKHIKRTRYAYQLTLAWLNTLRIQAYDKYCHDGYGQVTGHWHSNVLRKFVHGFRFRSNKLCTMDASLLERYGTSSSDPSDCPWGFYGREVRCATRRRSSPWWRLIRAMSTV